MAAFCPEGHEPSRSRSSSRSTQDPEDMTYDMLVTDFMLEVAARRPSLMQEFPDVFTRTAPLEDMFKYIWNLEEAVHTLSPTLNFSNKITKASYKYWVEGNSFMKTDDRDRALKFYNRSLIEAPHPVLTVDGKRWGQEQDDIVHSRSPSSSPQKKDPFKEDGWGDYKALAHAYEARARLLFSLQQFKKCIEDIDRVLALGCPLLMVEILKSMRVECENRGPGDYKQVMPLGKDLCIAFLLKTPEPPTLAEPNPAYPAFSSAVALDHDALHGRHMVATRDIETGEILSVDKAYSAVLNTKFLWEYCTVCLRRTFSPLPCPNCTKVVFCSEKCRSDGLAGCHKVECSILPTLIRLNMTNNAALAVRMFAEMGFHNMKSKVPPLLAEVSKTSKKERGLDGEGVYDSASYRTVYNLVTNRKKRGANDLLKRTMEAFVLLKLLILSEEYFVDESGNKIEVTEDDLIFTGAMLMHHMMTLWCNADTIGEMQHEEVESTASPVLAYGTALFPSTSLLNHACYSTCGSVSYGRMQVMRACRRIPAGTPITRQYANLYQRSLEDRALILQSRYHFICYCKACLGNWPRSLPKKLVDELRCVVCQEAVPEETQKCDDCNISYDRDGPVEGRPGVVAYNYSKVKERLDNALREYMLRVPRFMDGTDTNEDVAAIEELLYVYDTYVLLPTHGHIATQSLLHSVRLREGNSAFVKGENWQDCMVS